MSQNNVKKMSSYKIDKEKKADLDCAFNGWSVDKITISQEGDLEVEFDIPDDQTTDHYRIDRRGYRHFDIYEDEELQKSCRDLLNQIRERIKKPDPAQLELDCDKCAVSTCCKDYNVLVSDEDIALLAEGLDLSFNEVKSKYTDSTDDWSHDFSLQLKTQNFDEDDEDDTGCVFLKEDKIKRLRCSVYENRPQICRKFDVKCCDDFEALEV